MYSELKRTFILGVLGIAWIGYNLYTPVPPDLSSSVQFSIRKEHAIARAIIAAAWVAEQAGYGTMMHHLRSLREYKLSASQLHDEDIEASNITDTVFDSVPVRIYRPKSLPKSKNPAIIYYHGGGWALSTVGIESNAAQALSLRTYILAEDTFGRTLFNSRQESNQLYIKPLAEFFQ